MSYNYTPTLPDNLTAPENALIKATALGEPSILGDGARPTENCTDPARIIRADVIRFLALGGDKNHLVDPRGINLEGGIVVNKLELSNAIIPVDITFKKCDIRETLLHLGASAKTLSFQGSRNSNIRGDRLYVNGSIFLHDSLHSRGEIRFVNAKVDGPIFCGSSTFQNNEKVVLFCKGANNVQW